MKKFSAVLLQNGDMDAGYIEIPFDVEKEYKAKRVKVKVLLNGIEYRGSVVRMETTCHILGIPKVIRSEMGIKFGDRIEVEMQRDEEERIVILPEYLRQYIQEVDFQKLSYTEQKKHLLSIKGAKQESTRIKRIELLIKEINKK